MLILKNVYLNRISGNSLVHGKLPVQASLTEAQLKEGCKKCIENVQNLLDSAKLLLNNENSHQYALGLYVYAFEEFGKAEILKDHRTKNEYSLPAWIFGEGRDKRKAHFRKLSEAFKKLPPVCWELSNTIKIKITYNSSDIPQELEHNSNRRCNGKIKIE